MKILIRNGKKENWQLVQSAAYGAESELQKLLAEQPSLISLAEVREGCGPLVVAVREFPLDIGSIDLIAFTADGDVAVIECKLATNQEIKRKVIGQVMEYGANLWQMSYEALDDQIFLRTHKRLIDLIQENISDPTWDQEKFRSNVEYALQNGYFILMIAVDEIREELSRIVRFINDAGKPAFSIAALEMRRFQHQETEMLVPHVFGSTKSPKESQPGNRKKWDETSFFEALAEEHPESVETAKEILNWTKTNKRISRIWWGEGGRSGSFVPVVNHKDRDHQLFAVYTYGSMEVYFQWYQHKPPFDSEEKRMALLNRLNSIDGVNVPLDSITRRPSIKISNLKDRASIEQLMRVFDWVIQEVISS